MKKLIILSLVVVSQIYPTVNQLEDCYTSLTQQSLNPALSFKDQAKCIYLSIDKFPNNPGSPWCSALCDFRVLDAVQQVSQYASRISNACGDLNYYTFGGQPGYPTKCSIYTQRPKWGRTGAAAQFNNQKLFFPRG